MFFFFRRGKYLFSTAGKGMSVSVGGESRGGLTGPWGSVFTAGSKKGDFHPCLCTQMFFILVFLSTLFDLRLGACVGL